MKLYLTILSTTLFLITFSYPAIAGTSFTGLSGKVTVLDLAEEKRKSDTQQDKASSSLDFYRWALREIERNIEEPNLFFLDMALVSEQAKREGIDPEFFDKKTRNDLRIFVRDKKYHHARELVRKAQDKIKASSSISEQLDSIKQRVAKNEDADMDINRLIADLIFLEVNEKQEHTQLIMELQRMKTKPVGASVVSMSEVIDE